MKKHAEKSLILPFVILSTIVCLCAGICAVQVVNANADEGSSVNFATQNDTYHDINATIMLSDGAGFIGQEARYSAITEFEAWTGVKNATFENVSSLYSKCEDDFFDPNQTQVTIGGYTATEQEKLEIYIFLPKWRYAVNSVDINFYGSGNDSCRIVVSVSPSYYVNFNANGGAFEDGTSSQWISQGEYGRIVIPDNPSCEGKTFAGWYDSPWGGTKYSLGDQVPAFGELFVLYAHWLDEETSIFMNFSAENFGMFRYALTRNTVILEESDNAFYYEVPQEFRPKASYDVSAEFINQFSIGTCNNVLLVKWTEPNPASEMYPFNFVLYIVPIHGQRFTDVTINDVSMPLKSLFGYDGEYKVPLSWYNNFKLTAIWETPGFISVASDNGNMFKYTYQKMGLYGSEPVTYVTDYVPIFLEPGDFVFYTYYNYLDDTYSMNTHVNNGIGVPFEIIVLHQWTDLPSYEVYKFSDVLISEFDWFGINSYILGASVDGKDVPQGNYAYQLLNGYHTIELNMSGEKPVPPVPPDPPTPPDPPVPPDPPTPPEPVPPEPGPTPEPVKPGGGIAQTGDSMPLAPIAALAVIAALGCALALRKQF